MLNDPVNGSGHFCSDCGIRLAAQMGVVTVLGDITLELVTEAVRLLKNSDLSGHPEGTSQAGVAIF